MTLTSFSSYIFAIIPNLRDYNTAASIIPVILSIRQKQKGKKVLHESAEGIRDHPGILPRPCRGYIYEE